MQRTSGAVLFRPSLISVLIVSLWARPAGSTDRRGFSRARRSPRAQLTPESPRLFRGGYGVERTTYEVTIGFAVGVQVARGLVQRHRPRRRAREDETGNAHVIVAPVKS